MVETPVNGAAIGYRTIVAQFSFRAK